VTRNDGLGTKEISVERLSSGEKRDGARLMAQRARRYRILFDECNR